MPNTKDKKLDFSHVDDTMMLAPSMAKVLKVILLNSLWYPFKKKKIMEFSENVRSGLTDHPLDILSTPITSPLVFLKKMLRKKTSTVISIKLREHKGNSFIFDAHGYDIIKVRDMSFMFSYQYKIGEKTKFEALSLQLDIIRADTYRLRLFRGKEVLAHETPMIAHDISDRRMTTILAEDEEKYTIKTDTLRLELFKYDFRIEVYNAPGELITETSGRTRNGFPNTLDSFPLGFVTDKGTHDYTVESFTLYPGEYVYGLAEHFGPVNKVGQTIALWHQDGTGNVTGRAYKNIPFFVSTRGYGIFVNDTRYVNCWIGSREHCKTQIAVEGGEYIDYFFFYGPSIKNILYNYTGLTGRAPRLPKWSFGTWISRISYFSQQQVMDVAQKLRDLKFPSDVINIDTGWSEVDWICDFKFSKKRFPDPPKMFTDAREKGFRLCLWQFPYVTKEASTYPEAKKAKALARNNGPFIFLFAFPASPIDFSRPEGIEWYQKKIENLLKMGAAIIKVDFGEVIEPFMKFKKYSGSEMHNVYPLLYQKAAFDIIKKVNGEGIIWARSGFAGSQRYPVHWSGDNAANYENLLCCLRGGLSMGLCGFTYWSQDTGGFTDTCSDDLYVRWTQLSIFQSHIRYHGNPPKYREPWYYSAETQDIVRDYLNLRYQLIPYLYSESIVASSQGLPILRHLAIEFQDDPTVFGIEDQFMCGRSILVAPIMTKANKRSIYLPNGTDWYDYWNGEKLSGGQWIKQNADLSIIPIYLRAGSILPLAKPVQCTDELSNRDMSIRVYPDTNGHAEYKLVDDTEDINITAQISGDRIMITIDPDLVGTQIVVPVYCKNLTISCNGRQEV